MKNMYVTKNDGQVIKIKLSETVQITGLKMLRLMRKHKELNKSHWVNIIAILAGINNYTANQYGDLKLICGIQGLKPLEQASLFHGLMQYVKYNKFRVFNQDVTLEFPKPLREFYNQVLP